MRTWFVQLVAFGTGVCALGAIAGCEASRLATAAASGRPLREEQISFRGPITLREHSRGGAETSLVVPADDPLVVRLNQWARRSLAGARSDIVNYAIGFAVTGENFRLNFTGSLVVVDLWEAKRPVGSWSTEISAGSDAILDTLRKRLSSSARP